MFNVPQKIVSDEENVVRILSNGWVVDGVLQQTAFTLRDGETYISVNRPAVSSFASDVALFVKSHKNFQTPNSGSLTYQSAVMNVGAIRGIVVTVDNQPLAIDVEVEPRDVFTKSHAGIFTRHGNKNVKTGGTLAVGLEENLSADAVLLKVRLALMRISAIKQSEVQ